MRTLKWILLLIVLSVVPSFATSAQDSAPPFEHSSCNGVDLAGQTITFYQLINLSDQVDTLVDPLRAGFEDAAAYFNAHGGICGATIDIELMGDDPSGVTQLAQLDTPPLMIGLYSSGGAEDTRDMLAAAEIPALLVRGGSVKGLYGNDSHTLGWVFGTNPLYLNQIGSICDYIAAHPDIYPDPSLGFISQEDDWSRRAITDESVAYCEAQGVPIVGKSFFGEGSTNIDAQVQTLLDAGANILYTMSLEESPALVASTLQKMGIRDQIALLGVNLAMDPAVAAFGTDALGDDGLPPLNGMVGVLPARSFAETDNAGIQFITAQADANDRPANLRNRAYISAWTAADLFIETVIQTGNRVGWLGMNGAGIKDTLENIVYAPLGGVQQIDYQGGTRRDLGTSRMGILAYLGEDGINPASADNPLFQPVTPLLLPLTDFQPVPDLRPAGVDVEQGDATTEQNTSANTNTVTVGTLPFGTLVFQIGYGGTDDAHAEIAVMGTDGVPVRLTDNNVFDGQPVWSPDGSHIVFVSQRDGNQEVYVMDPDGTNIVNVSNSPAFDEVPSWSPDGSQIAFISDRAGQNDVWIANADGTDPVNLTDDPAFDGFGAWSPDGTQIAFTSDRDGSNEIYVINLDGSGLTKLTENIGAYDFFPIWSPDGTKIVFESNRDGTGNAYVMNANGGDLTNLTASLCGAGRPNWSPDGEWIVFDSGCTGRGELYVENVSTGVVTRVTDTENNKNWASWRADEAPVATVGALPFGTLVFEMGRAGGESNTEIATLSASGEVTQLTDNAFFDGEPIWSPDGSQIVFGSNRDGNFEVYVMEADGSNPVNITNSPTIEDTPWWSPDGTQILFNSDRTGDMDIWIANADGGNPVNLTDNPANDFMASWSPDGTHIAFVSVRDGNAEIYVINANGTNPTRLTDDSGDDIFPVWSPDGTKLLWNSNRDGDMDTYIMNADGSNPVNLSMDRVDAEKATWSPDGEWVLLSSNVDGIWAQYIKNIASGTIIRLTGIAEREVWPSWKR